MLKRLFFGDVTPLIKLGLRKNLEPQDLFPTPDFASGYNKIVDEDKLVWGSTSWALVRSLFLSARRQLIPAYALLTLDAVAVLSTPVLLNQFVTSLDQVTDSPGVSVAWGLSLALAALVSGTAIQHYFFRILGVYQIFTNALNRKIYRQALKIKKSEKDQLPVGDVVNHMSSDSDALADLGPIIGDCWYLFLVTTGFVVLLFYYLGHTAWVGLGALALLFPVIKGAGGHFTALDENLKKKRDQRISLMSQILSSIRVIKSFVWEKSMLRDVRKVRHQELRFRGQLARAEMSATVIFVGLGTLILFLVMLAHSLRGFELNVALVFTLVSILKLIEEPFAMFSKMVSGLAEAKVSADRLIKFVSLPARDVKVQVRALDLDCAIQVRGLSVHYPSAKAAALSDLNFYIRNGENFAVVGPVGSGKTSLLMALLGETEFQGEVAMSSPRRALVTQEPFILNASLRSNLTFGLNEVSETDLHKALFVSGLVEDLKSMPAGFETELGEKGLNLSGGQKQRLSLARVALRNPDILFLDDPLSSVDPVVEKHLIEKLILGEWKNKTRVTVTHRLEHLPTFDRILFLSSGQKVALGSFQELLLNPQFQDFVKDQSQISGAGHEDALKKDVAEVAKVIAPLDTGRITTDEDREYGAVQSSVYWKYIQSLAGRNGVTQKRILVLLLGSAVFATSLPLLQRFWLARFSEQGEKFFLGPVPSLLIYGILGVLTLTGVLASDLYWLRRGLVAGRDLHDRMLKAVLGARVQFFDSQPIGRILQRFSRDVEAVDIELQWCFENSIKAFLQVIVNLVLILVVVPAVALVIAPVMWVYYRLQKDYRHSAREVKRLDSVHRSPRYAHFKETLNGLVTVRGLGAEAWFYEQFASKLTFSQRMFYSHYKVNRWFSSRIPLVAAIVSAATTSFLVLAVYQGSIGKGLAGLVAVSCFWFWGLLNWGVRLWADVEARMTSVERIRTFIDTPTEEPLRDVGASTSENWPENWPEKGSIEFDQVKMRYSENLPLVLQGLSFSVAGGTRVGIVGRTGAGKSSLFQALLRFTEIESGSIKIDGVDIRQVKLAQLRRSIAVIPQDPSLFLGTLRSNLDRFNEFSEAQIWNVVDQVQLRELVENHPEGLNQPVVENGANFSQGQRQLFCLARALLVNSRIIILDEATASVDVKTDAVVQSILERSCADQTMLIIAHRLGTVRDCDQILELSEGKLRRVIVPHGRKNPRNPHIQQSVN